MFGGQSRRHLGNAAAFSIADVLAEDEHRIIKAQRFIHGHVRRLCERDLLCSYQNLLCIDVATEFRDVGVVAFAGELQRIVDLLAGAISRSP